VDLIEFEGRVYDALIELREACEANPAVREQALPKDELICFVTVKT